jgi:hypothetical protein
LEPLSEQGGLAGAGRGGNERAWDGQRPVELSEQPHPRHRIRPRTRHEQLGRQQIRCQRAGHRSLDRHFALGGWCAAGVGAGGRLGQGDQPLDPGWLGVQAESRDEAGLDGNHIRAALVQLEAGDLALAVAGGAGQLSPREQCPLAQVAQQRAEAGEGGWCDRLLAL